MSGFLWIACAMSAYDLGTMAASINRYKPSSIVEQPEFLEFVEQTAPAQKNMANYRTMQFTGEEVCSLRFLKFHQVGGTTIQKFLQKASKLSPHIRDGCVGASFDHEDGWKNRGQTIQVTVMRDPVEKFLSAFYKLLFHSEDDLGTLLPEDAKILRVGGTCMTTADTVLKKHSFDEMSNSTLVEEAVRAVLNARPDCRTTEVTSFFDVHHPGTPIEKAKEELKKFDVVGLTEEMDHFVSNLCKVLDIKKDECHLTDTVVHSGESVKNLRENSHRPRTTSPELRAFIESKIPKEVALYQFAKALSHRPVGGVKTNAASDSKATAKTKAKTK